MKAFRDLHTCRQLGYSSLGPIPWTDMVFYAERFGLDEDLIDPFIYILRAMDVAYQDWIDKEKKKGEE